jgi:hypothetical protein
MKMSGHVGGSFTNLGVILVLFILLVIIACSCGVVGGSSCGGYGNVGGAGVGPYGKGY